MMVAGMQLSCGLVPGGSMTCPHMLQGSPPSYCTVAGASTGRSRQQQDQVNGALLECARWRCCEAPTLGAAEQQATLRDEE
jgi:hypothetical protein